MRMMIVSFKRVPSRCVLSFRSLNLDLIGAQRAKTITRMCFLRCVTRPFGRAFSAFKPDGFQANENLWSKAKSRVNYIGKRGECQNYGVIKPF